MRRSILGAAVLTLGLALGAGLSGEAKAFPGTTLAIGSAEAADGSLLQQVGHKHKHKHWKHKHKHWHKKHHWKHKHWKHRHRHHHGGFVINLGGIFGPQVVQRDCQQVVRDGYAYGRPAKLASTLCYDQFGRGYIVPGSDQVIQIY